MLKKELVQKIVTATELSYKKSSEIVDIIFNAIAEDLIKGNSTNINGFGTFLVRERAARYGRNLQTGERIFIEARKIPAFKASSILKKAVQKEQEEE